MKPKKASPPPPALTTVRRKSAPVKGARAWTRHCRGRCKDTNTRYYVSFPETEGEEYTDLNAFFYDCAARFVQRRQHANKNEKSPDFSSLCCKLTESEKHPDTLKVTFTVTTRRKNGRELQRTYHTSYETKTGMFTRRRA